jgi:hypothetical protein
VNLSSIELVQWIALAGSTAGLASVGLWEILDVVLLNTCDVTLVRLLLTLGLVLTLGLLLRLPRVAAARDRLGKGSPPCTGPKEEGAGVLPLAAGCLLGWAPPIMPGHFRRTTLGAISPEDHTRSHFRYLSAFRYLQLAFPGNGGKGGGTSTAVR